MSPNQEQTNSQNIQYRQSPYHMSSSREKTSKRRSRNFDYDDRAYQDDHQIDHKVDRLGIKYFSYHVACLCITLYDE